MATVDPVTSNAVAADEPIKENRISSNKAQIRRIHVIKYVVMTVSIFLVFPLLVYWVATPDAPVHREYLCIDATQTGAGMFTATSAVECKQVVSVQPTLQGVRHSPGLDAVFGQFKTTNIAAAPRYTPYANDVDGAAICDVFGTFQDDDGNDHDSPAKRTCMNHKAIRPAVVAVFILMIVAGLASFWMCRVTEGELLREEDRVRAGNREIAFTLDNLEGFMGWRGTVGLIWGALLASAVLWQIQVHDKLYNGVYGGSGTSAYRPDDDAIGDTITTQWADSHSTGGTAFGAGITKLLQVYLWALFSLFTAKVYVNRRARIKNPESHGAMIGDTVIGDITWGLAPKAMTGVTVELAPTQQKRPHLTVDPHKLTTHNMLMRQTMPQ